MKPGLYFLGDPCYVYANDDRWQDLCAGDFSDTESHPDIVGLNTAWGDGEYYDQYGFPYSVDSGMIGAVRIDTDSQEYEYLDQASLHECPGRIVQFDSEFQASVVNGLITIGDYRIDTDEEEEEEEEYYCEMCGCEVEDWGITCDSCMEEEE